MRERTCSPTAGLAKQKYYEGSVCRLCGNPSSETRSATNRSREEVASPIAGDGKHKSYNASISSTGHESVVEIIHCTKSGVFEIAILGCFTPRFILRAYTTIQALLCGSLLFEHPESAQCALRKNEERAKPSPYQRLWPHQLKKEPKGLHAISL